MIRCEDVKKYYSRRTGRIRAVDGVSLEIEKGESFGLVGESGCGKTTLGKIILGIVKPDSGRIIRDTKNMQVIFQDPFNSLDPKMKVSEILAEGLVIKGQGVRGQVEEALDLVKLPAEALRKYPHEFSGGQRQRIAIARAVITRPEFIVCDEPVSSLDVTIQLQILKLLKDIRKAFNISYLFISHDLKVIKFMCENMAVMKDGSLIEKGKVKDIYSNPSHPYTRNLFRSAFYDNIKLDE